MTIIPRFLQDVLGFFGERDWDKGRGEEEREDRHRERERKGEINR